VERALADLKQLQAKHSRLSELENVWNAIDAANMEYGKFVETQITAAPKKKKGGRRR
jgi:hypothetical protein